MRNCLLRCHSHASSFGCRPGENLRAAGVFLSDSEKYDMMKAITSHISTGPAMDILSMSGHMDVHGLPAMHQAKYLVLASGPGSGQAFAPDIRVLTYGFVGSGGSGRGLMKSTPYFLKMLSKNLLTDPDGEVGHVVIRSTTATAIAELGRDCSVLTHCAKTGDYEALLSKLCNGDGEGVMTKAKEAAKAIVRGKVK